MALIQRAGSLPPPSWPNQETLTTSAKVVVNLACYLINNSLITAAVINFPVRCFSIYQTPQSKRHYKLPMDIAAFIILPFPHGVLFSIGLDTISEVINFYKERPKTPPQNHPILSSLKRLDPKNFENACKILGLEKGEEKDSNKVEAKYKQILQELEKRKSKASVPIAEGFQAVIDDTKAAYLTLTSV